MFEQKDRHPDDHLGVGRGIVFGVLFGLILWGAILTGLWLLLK